MAQKPISDVERRDYQATLHQVYNQRLEQPAFLASPEQLACLKYLLKTVEDDLEPECVLQFKILFNVFENNIQEAYSLLDLSLFVVSSSKQYYDEVIKLMREAAQFCPYEPNEEICGRVFTFEEMLKLYTFYYRVSYPLDATYQKLVDELNEDRSDDHVITKDQVRAFFISRRQRQNEITWRLYPPTEPAPTQPHHKSWESRLIFKFIKKRTDNRPRKLLPGPKPQQQEEQQPVVSNQSSSTALQVQLAGYNHNPQTVQQTFDNMRLLAPHLAQHYSEIQRLEETHQQLLRKWQTTSVDQPQSQIVTAADYQEMVQTMVDEQWKSVQNVASSLLTILSSDEQRDLLPFLKPCSSNKCPVQQPNLAPSTMSPLDQMYFNSLMEWYQESVKEQPPDLLSFLKPSKITGSQQPAPRAMSAYDQKYFNMLLEGYNKPLKD